MSSFFQIKSYITYWLDAVDEHSLHSPYFFDFYTKIIKDKNHNTENKQIESLRNQLLQNKRIIPVKDLGAGSKTLNHTERKISEIAATSLSPQKYSSLYSRIIQYYKLKNILELGTSFGINTLYLSPDKSRNNVVTFEGCPEIAEIAKLTFEFTESKNIHLIEGDINATLSTYLQRSPKIDFAFLDANHRYDPTLKYFQWLVAKAHEKTIMILDDIHYSREMEKAWTEIKNHKLVYGSADLYRCGILFFDPSLNKQHVILQF